MSASSAPVPASATLVIRLKEACLISYPNDKEFFLVDDALVIKLAPHIAWCLEPILSKDKKKSRYPSDKERFTYYAYRTRPQTRCGRILLSSSELITIYFVMAAFRQPSNRGKTKKMMIADPAFNSKENVVNGAEQHSCPNMVIADVKMEHQEPTDPVDKVQYHIDKIRDCLSKYFAIEFEEATETWIFKNDLFAGQDYVENDQVFRKFMKTLTPDTKPPTNTKPAATKTKRRLLHAHRDNAAMARRTASAPIQAHRQDPNDVKVPEIDQMYDGSVNAHTPPAPEQTAPHFYVHGTQQDEQDAPATGSNAPSGPFSVMDLTLRQLAALDEPWSDLPQLAMDTTQLHDCIQKLQNMYLHVTGLPFESTQFQFESASLSDMVRGFNAEFPFNQLLEHEQPSHTTFYGVGSQSAQTPIG